MLLGSLVENIFGFTGTYAKKAQASLAPIYGLETLDRIQRHEQRQDTSKRLVRDPQDIGFDLNKQSGKSSIMERGSLWVQRQQEGNTQDIWTRTPHNLSSGCTDPKKKEELCKKRTPTGVSPLLDLYHSFQTDGLRHPQGNRQPSLNHPGTDSYRDHISVYEYLPIHGRQSHGTNWHVDHDGELDKQTKEQPNYNAGGPKLCTPGLPMGLRTTS